MTRAARPGEDSAKELIISRDWPDTPENRRALTDIVHGYERLVGQRSPEVSERGPNPPASLTSTRRENRVAPEPRGPLTDQAPVRSTR